MWTHCHPCRWLTFFLGLSFAAVAQDVGYDNRNQLPEIGVVASEAVPLDKELMIGTAVMRQMRGQAPLLSDPVLIEYLQDLGNRLVVHADNVKFPFHFFWVNNDVINAFAFFGGHIGVHTGLIHHAKTESELASVLAHEIAHVTQRHIARRMMAQQRSAPLALASMLGGVLLGMANPQAGMAAISAGQAASMQIGLDYTRANETEADRIGINMLARAGFDTRGAADFFSVLMEMERLGSRMPERLRSHPLSQSRVSDARSRAMDYPTVNLPPSLSFGLAKHRVMARYTLDKHYALSYYENLVSQPLNRQNIIAQYGYAIALMRHEEYQKALDIIAPLIKRLPENTFLLDVATDIFIDLGQPESAVDLLSAHYERIPRNGVIALNYANALLSAKQYESAVKVLRDYLLVSPESEIALQLLVEVYREQQQFMDMHQSKAEVLALYGAYPQAVDELQFAYNFTEDNHLEKQRIRARIQQFRAEEQKLRSL